MVGTRNTKDNKEKEVIIKGEHLSMSTEMYDNMKAYIEYIVTTKTKILCDEIKLLQSEITVLQDSNSNSNIIIQGQVTNPLCPRNTVGLNTDTKMVNTAKKNATF
ncbi:hypothetical protein HHI36_016804 [Cryptolaemus montrouzieri]|uniref:Uncharacterized protein n=1 Tax=Cryptolaemus montrouzieri TaxID=559131 RepID=A0ABD2NLU5_9CUCU